jgi:hypothetical protein
MALLVWEAFWIAPVEPTSRTTVVVVEVGATEE